MYIISNYGGNKYLMIYHSETSGNVFWMITELNLYTDIMEINVYHSGNEN